MNELMTIQGVRAYLDENGTAQLHIEDVARGLGFTRVANSGNIVVRWERVGEYLSDLGVPTSGHEDFSPQVGKDGFIPENIFYRLCMKASNETAQKFQALVCDEVLPSIRKHGIYATPQAAEAILNNPDFMIITLQTLKAEREARRAAEEKIVEQAPKVAFADAVSASGDSIHVGTLAKVLNQNGLNIGQNRLYRWLRENGYLISRRGGTWNTPTQRSMEQGLFEVKETAVVHSNGSSILHATTMVTGKGQQYFINRLTTEDGYPQIERK